MAGGYSQEIRGNDLAQQAESSIVQKIRKVASIAGITAVSAISGALGMDSAPEEQSLPKAGAIEQSIDPEVEKINKLAEKFPQGYEYNGRFSHLKPRARNNQEEDTLQEKAEDLQKQYIRDSVLDFDAYTPIAAIEFDTGIDLRIFRRGFGFDDDKMGVNLPGLRDVINITLATMLRAEDENPYVDAAKQYAREAMEGDLKHGITLIIDSRPRTCIDSEGHRFLKTNLFPGLPNQLQINPEPQVIIPESCSPDGSSSKSGVLTAGIASTQVNYWSDGLKPGYTNSFIAIARPPASEGSSISPYVFLPHELGHTAMVVEMSPEKKEEMVKKFGKDSEHRMFVTELGHDAASVIDTNIRLGLNEQPFIFSSK